MGRVESKAIKPGQLYAAAKRLETLKRQECFDPSNLDSTPTPAQLEVLKDIKDVSHRYINAGNQSIPGWSLVTMVDGSMKPMQDVKEGDEVMCFDYTLHRLVPGFVTKKHNHGQKEVFRYWMEDDTYADRTDYHEMVVYKGTEYQKVRADETDYFLTCVDGSVNDVYKKKVESLGVHEIYDITVSHHNSVYVCDGYLTGNSGKSQLAARETAWVLTETHPYWKRPERIGQDKLQLLVLGRVGKQIEEVLWRKIYSFLDPESVHIQRIGGTIQKVTYKPNGNTILFLSHHNTNEAREKAQGFTADYVWIDELPGSVKIFEELHRRVQARDGRLIATFTPKTYNKEIREWVDNLKAPYSKKYTFSMLDNPIYTEAKKKQLIEEMSSMPEGFRRMVLNGDWYAGDGAVYNIPENFEEAPEGYSPAWRHVESCDPALSSKFGITVWAENPETNIWYCIRSEYIAGIPDPNEMFEAAQKITKGLNIVKRVCDPEANWYTGLARGKGVHYVGPNKVGRKAELIKNLQTLITTGRLKCAPWCDVLLKEFETCQWSETSREHIVNSHSFHTIDSAQYFADLIPKPEKVPLRGSWEQQLRAANEKIKKDKQVTRLIGRRQWKLRRY
jgi:phage terminase large subunit-like protein